VYGLYIVGMDVSVIVQMRRYRVSKHRRITVTGRMESLAVLSTVFTIKRPTALDPS
jgi:hypothetical protein